MIDNGEETDILGRITELCCDLIDAIVEIVEGDLAIERDALE